MILNVINKFSARFLHHNSLAGYIEPIVQRMMPAWRSDLYRAKVKVLRLKKAGYLYLELEPQRQWRSFTAGQHIELTVEVNGRLLTRVFTIASSPNYFIRNHTIVLLIKRNKLGRLTDPLITALKANDWLNISAAKGKFTLANDHKKLVMVAGGSGITPIISMIDQHLAVLTKPVYLRYIAAQGSHQFSERLTDLALAYPHFSYHILSRQRHIENPLTLNCDDDVYCCGPASLMVDIEYLARQAGSDFYQEHFSLTPIINEQQAEFKVVFNQQVHTVSNNESLLAQLERDKAPVIRGCGIGVCHQCQCIKRKGVVKNLKTGEISDGAPGLIQLCISQPLTDLEITV